jgi:hypothetical protein
MSTRAHAIERRPYLLTIDVSRSVKDKRAGCDRFHSLGWNGVGG